MIFNPVRPVVRPELRGGRGLGLWRIRRPGQTRDRGAVTAETAVAIPSLLIVLTILVWIILVVTAQLRVYDAARAGARAAARGETTAQSVAVAEEMAPPGADAVITRDDGDVRVEVRMVVEPPGGIPLLPSIEIEAVAHAAAEDAVDLGFAGHVESTAPP